ncbi:MAG: VRR-NUC domain-containing protein [Selenomonadales bacterium]|nr:VRR-NUC domain-containing protein [Selenomonadales bacterium]
MNETDLMNMIRLRLTECGFTVFRVNVAKVRLPDGRFFKTGLPRGFSDLFAVKDGRAYFIEVKTGNNKPTQEQLNFIEQMKKKGCTAGVVWSVREAERLCLTDT